MICVPNFSSLSWFSFWSNILIHHQLSTAVDSWWQLIWKKITEIFICTLKFMCAKFQLSRLIFVFIKSCQLLSAVDSWYEKKIDWNLYLHTKVYMSANFQLIGWISFYQLLSGIDSFWQLLTADDSWYEKKLTGIFM